MENSSKISNGVDQEVQTEEIDLMDGIRVILKRKWLILGLFLVGVVGAGIITRFLPTKYQGETSLEIGQISKLIGTVSEKKLIESPPQLVEKIKSGFYGNFPGIEAVNPQNTNIVKIEVTTKDPENAKKILENINNSILAEHNNKINSQKEILEKNLEKNQRNIDFLIEKIQKDISSLIYRDQQIASLQAEIYSLQRELQLENDKLQSQLQDFQPTQIIQEPSIPLGKKPNLILNLVFGGILGIFLGVIFVFGKEWWEKNRVRL